MDEQSIENNTPLVATALLEKTHMAPSRASTTSSTPKRFSISRPRSLSLHTSTAAPPPDICSPTFANRFVQKSNCNNNNFQHIDNGSKVFGGDHATLTNGNRHQHLSDIRDSGSMDENRNSPPKNGLGAEKTRLSPRLSSERENLKKGQVEKPIFSTSSSATSPTSGNISAFAERSQLSKQLLRKTPSTPGSSSSTRLPMLTHQSSCRVTTSSAPLSSPTSRSRLALPTSPSANAAAAVGGVHSKRHTVDDHNPFGADLVRYQNGGGTLTSARPSLNGGRGISENSAGSLCAMNTLEETALLGKSASVKESNAAGNNRVLDNEMDSPVSVEKSAGVLFYKDTWHESNNAGGGGGFLRNRFSTRRIRNRLMQKDGECNISLHNVPKQKAKYFSDIFTTLVEVKWRWCLLIFAMGFLLSWLLFAVIYYLIMYTHGDFEHAQNDTNWKFCVHSINNFVSVFMFSLESQHTIGYGSRYPSEECPTIVATVCLQSMVGVMIQTFMAGIVFAKLARAKKRAETLIFSKHAVVCMRDGKLCFLFRVGDMRKSQLAEAHVRLQMISKRITNEGELLPFHQFDMNVGYDAGLDRIFVVWPITICHVIDENSPLYEYSADDLATARFEIIAILEGVVPSTGTTTQARTSYLPQEIIWGSRFEKLVTYQRENGEYRIDFSKFHKTYTQETPTCSARDLDLLREAGLNLEEVYHIEGEEQAENQGLTPYSTVESRVEQNRPSILPPKEEPSNSVIEIAEPENKNDNLVAMDEESDETGHLLPAPPSASALLTMSPAERKASIAAAAAAFRKNKSLSESARKASLVACHRFRKPSINVTKVGNSEHPSLVMTTPSAHQTPLAITPTHHSRMLRHAASTGSVAVVAPPHPCVAVGCTLKSRPSSILREHDIM